MDKDIFIEEEKSWQRQYVELTRKKNKWKVDYQPHIM